MLYREFQAKLLSFPWFSAARANVIVYENHFCYLHQESGFVVSKDKFEQANNLCKRVLTSCF